MIAISYTTQLDSRGLGAALCKDVAGYQGEAGVEHQSHHLAASLKSTKNHGSGTTLTTKFTMKTSKDSGLPSGHLILTPALTIKFAETREISYNLTACEAESKTIITWALGGASNVNAFTLKGYDDIADLEVHITLVSIVFFLVMPTACRFQG